jgi:hypothetical protein
LASIWKYCWAPDVGVQNAKHTPARIFAYPGEAGLFTCTWPKSMHLGPKSTRYRNEIWTGIEYQVANHMAYEGMLTETLAICRAVHDRYHPSKHNPFNEIECGDHYARALASWGVLLGLAGFEYHGPQRHIGFLPRLAQDRFRIVYTSADGWGTYAQQREGNQVTYTLSVRWGQLAVRSLALAVPDGQTVSAVTVQAPAAEVAVEFVQQQGRLQLTLRDELVVPAGAELNVRVTC